MESIIRFAGTSSTASGPPSPCAGKALRHPEGKPSGCFGAAEGDSLSHPAGRDTPDDSSLGEGAKGDTSSVIRLAGIGG